MKKKSFRETSIKYLIVLLTLVSTIPGAFLVLIYFISDGVYMMVAIACFTVMLIGIINLYLQIKKKFPTNEWSSSLALTSIVMPMHIGLIMSLVSLMG